MEEKTNNRWQYFIEILSEVRGLNLDKIQKACLVVVIIGRLPLESQVSVLQLVGLTPITTIVIISIFSLISLPSQKYIFDLLINQTRLHDGKLFKIMRLDNKESKHIKVVTAAGLLGLFIVSLFPTGSFISTTVLAITHIKYGMATVLVGNTIRIVFTTIAASLLFSRLGL